MADELDLEHEIDALAEEIVKDEDFDDAPIEESDDTDSVDDDDEVEPEPEPAKPQIADDREAEQARAAEVVNQWRAYASEKEGILNEIRRQLIEADDLDKPAEERVAIQSALAEAMIDAREAKKGLDQAAAYQQQVNQPRAKAAEEWIARNPKFKTDPAFKARVEKIARKLREEEGMSESHPRMYQELDKRLRAKPVLGKRGKQGAAPVQRSSQSAASKDAPSDFDKKWMARIGLNPSDKKHLSEWKHHYSEMAQESR